MANVLKSFADQKETKEILGENSNHKNVTLHVDTVNKKITVNSDDVDDKGRPIHEWEMDKETGHVTKTKRT